MNRKSKSVNRVVGVRMPPDLDRKIREVAAKNHLADSDIIRMSIERGLAVLESMLAAPAQKAA